MDLILLAFTDYTLRTVIMGTALLGIVSGALGSFAVLRKQSLLGDAISHAALPGICLAFLVFMTKSPFLLFLGAVGAGWLGTIMMMLVTKHTRLKQDAILGIVLSVFFGFGLVLLTWIQRMPNASQSGLNTFLFGNASTLLVEDVTMMAVLGVIVLVILIAMWKEFKILSFDPDFAHVSGFRVTALDVTLTTLIVVAIVLGLQTVGVVLMSAMVIAPAAAARQWTDRLGLMVVVAAIIGAFSGVIGALISSSVPKLPTGPTIVLVVSAFVMGSLLFAPNRGLLWAAYHQYQNRKHLRAQTVLANLFSLAQNHDDPHYPHDIAALRAIGHAAFSQAMRQLESESMVLHHGEDLWGLTDKGIEKAQSVAKDIDS
ncbi:metal ABC transporter permease [bacterium]|jgi:manganese/zinc/iron transport system permease protein|nr:metal ABC transporter permease [bacterium]